MNFFTCYVFLIAVCGFSGLFAKKVRLLSRHNLVKRQADYNAQNSQTDTSNSDQDGASSGGRRHFVSPDGEPYYEYQPPVSTSRGTSGGRSATSHVRIGGQGRSASVPTYSSEVRRSRTYNYPFGRERTQYVQEQSESGSSQDSGSAIDTGSSSSATHAQQHQTARTQGHSQRHYYSSSSHRSAASDQDRSRESPSNQQSSYSPEEQEARRRHEELRRQHEEERQRRLEERRRREEERRRLEEERRRQEEERRVLEEERRRESEARRRQYEQERQNQQQERQNQQQERQNQQQGRQNQQQTQTTTTTEASIDEDSEETTTTPDYRSGSRDGTRNRQSYTRYSNQHGTSSQQQPVSGQTSSQRGIYDSTGQAGVYRSTYGQQQGSYVPTNQQGTYSTNSQRQHTYYTQQRQQQPVYSSVSRTVTDQEPVYRSSSTTYRQGSQTYPGQQSRVFYQQPGYVDPRRVMTSQGGTYPGFRTQYEYSSGSQGQGQGFYDPYNPFNYLGGTDAGSLVPYGTQNAFSECPDTGLVLRISGMTCEQAIQQHGSYLCYAHEYTSRECCEVCRPLKQASRIGCEYGDHAELCSQITPSDCYDLRNRQSCCESCERYRKEDAPAGCEYGDMTVRCEDVRQNPGLCYIPDNQRLCCETCNRIRNSTNPSCPWGDYNSNLCQVFDEQTSGVRINCYSPQRRRMCCEACERLRSWLPDDLPADCPYGDRPVIFSTGQFGRLNCSTIFNVFTTEECRTNRAVSVNCCHTCHRFLRGRG